MLLISDVIRGYTDTIILSRLRNKDSYGYEINKAIKEISDEEFELKEATLYTTFQRLERDGYIVSYWGDENTGARRKYYTITKKGIDLYEENLRDWKRIREMIENLLA